MNALVMYDDERARSFEPFALTRPVSELRAGTELIRRRWEMAIEAKAVGFAGAPHLTDFEEPDAPPMVGDTIEAGTVIASSRCAVSLARADTSARTWRCAGRVAAVRLDEPISAAALREGTVSLEALAPHDEAPAEIDGWWLEDVWDLIRHLADMLAADVPLRIDTLDTMPARDTGAAVIGVHAAVVEHGASVDPYVVFDTKTGPILVRRGATIAPFTRLVGPCYIGEDTSVAGGRIACCAIGDSCRAHGELSMSVFLGHANKSHEGFIGHSYLGRWTNLGASTVTSNLKNTYGPVVLWTPTGLRDSGMQFLGTFFGDHAKTAIGTRLTTGCVVGAGANVVSAGTTPKVIPPFSWGADSGPAVYELDRFLSVVERVMDRRHMPLTERAKRWLSAAHGARWQVG